jgi:hypothetical protein
MQPLVRTAALALVAALILAACGGGSHPTSTSTSSSTAGASVPTTATLTQPQTTTPTTATLTTPQTTTTRTTTSRTRTSTTRTSTTHTSTTRTSTTRTSTTRPPRRHRRPRGPTRAQLGTASCRRGVEQTTILTNDEKAQLEQLCQFAWNGNRAGVAKAKRTLCITIVADSGLVGPTAAAEIASCERSGQPAQPIPPGGIPPGASFALR